MSSLQRFLVDYDMALLRALAQNRGLVLDTNLQPEAVDRLAAALVEPLSVRTALARLSVAARTALDALLAAGGRMRVPQFSRSYGQIRPVGPGRLEREAPWQDPANAAEELWYAGLIYRAFVDEQGGPGEFYLVPDDLRPLLPQPEASQPPFDLETVLLPAALDVEDVSLVRDLFVYLVYLQNHDVRPYADGRLGRQDRAALQQMLAERAALQQMLAERAALQQMPAERAALQQQDGGDDERRLAFVRHLAGRLGLIRQDGLLRLEAAAAKRWLAAPPAHQILSLQEAWRDDLTWIDLCHVPSLVCDEGSGWLRRYDPLAARRALLALLARCPVDAWWTLDSFVSAVKAAHPDFERPDGDYGSWYIREAGSNVYLSGFESWDRVEGALIRDLVDHTLSWLGVVHVVQGQQGPVCRLAPAGLHFLDLVPAQESVAPLPIVVQPDFAVQVPAPPNLYTRFQLERFADLESEDPCCYRLTVGGLGRALGRGIQVEQILAFLRQASGDRVPTNVVGQLGLWAGRLGQVQLEDCVLLTTRSEAAMKELSVLPETRSLLGRLLSPTSALVRKQDLPRLRQALQALGFLPPDAG